MKISQTIPVVSNALQIKAANLKNSPAALISARLISNYLLGEDNEGLLSLSEYGHLFRKLRLVSNLPLIADAQSGFGNALNAYKTAQELARSGADYLLLNDQKYPSHSQIPNAAENLPDFLGKIQAALDGIADSNCQLILKFEGPTFYGLSGLKERIALAQALKINFVLSRLTVPQLQQLQAAGFLPAFNFSYSLDDANILPDALAEFKPAFIFNLQAELPTTSFPTVTEKPVYRNNFAKFKAMRKKFRQAVFTKDKIVNLVVAPDSLSAKIAEKLGYQAIFAAGYATSASNLAKPDRGLADFGIMVNKCREIVNAVNIPVFADADTGYGDTKNIARTVRSYEMIGACGLFLEDQVWPKHCGHMAGKKVEPTEVLAAKIKAATQARQDPNFLIMSRTDARAVYDLKEAIARSKQYLAAGADLVFIEAPRNIEELKAEIKAFPDTPLMLNMIEGGATPIMSVAEARKLGFRIIVHPTALTYAQTFAVKRVLSILQQTGKTAGAKDVMLSFDEFNKFIGLNEVNDREQHYAAEKMELVLQKLKSQITQK